MSCTRRSSSPSILITIFFLLVTMECCWHVVEVRKVQGLADANYKGACMRSKVVSERRHDLPNKASKTHEVEAFRPTSPLRIRRCMQDRYEVKAFRPTTPGNSPGVGHDNPPGSHKWWWRGNIYMYLKLCVLGYLYIYINQYMWFGVGIKFVKS